MYICLNVKYLLFLSDFSETVIFLTKFLKNAHISNFKKICPVGAEMFNVDRQTDVAKLAVTSSKFVNVPKNGFQLSVALVCERTIPTERPPPVGEVSANFCG